MNLARIQAGEIVAPSSVISCGDFSCDTPTDFWTLTGTASISGQSVDFGSGGGAEQDLGPFSAGGLLNGSIEVSADALGVILQVYWDGDISGSNLITSGIFGAGNTTVFINNYEIPENESGDIRVVGAAGGTSRLTKVTLNYSNSVLQELDLFPDFAIPANFQYFSTEQLGGLSMPITSQISLPLTERNKDVLGVSSDATLKPTDKDCKVFVGNADVYRYRLKVDSVITLGLNERIEVTLVDPLKSAVEKFKDMTLSDLVDDGEYDFYINATAITNRNSDPDDFIKMVYQDFNGFGEDDPRMMTFRPETNFDEKDGVQHLVPALKVKSIFSKAFQKINMGYDSKFFNGTTEIENYPVEDMYMMSPVRFFLDKDKPHPVSGVWGKERTDNVGFWKAISMVNVFGFIELYNPNNPNQIIQDNLNYLRANNIISGASGSQNALFDVVSLNATSGVFTTNQMVFKKPARYSISFTESVRPRFALIKRAPSSVFSNPTQTITGNFALYLVVSVNGGIKQTKLADLPELTAANQSTYQTAQNEYDFGQVQISVPEDFYVDIDTGDAVEMYITMQSEDGIIEYVNSNGNTYSLSVNDFGTNPNNGSYVPVFCLGNHNTELRFKKSSQLGTFTEPLYDIEFSPYESFPVSSYSGGEQFDFKFNLKRASERSLYDIMVDIAKRFNMSFAYDFANDQIIVDNLLEEYVKPSSTENIVSRFDNKSELTQNFVSSGLKRVELLNASGQSVSDKYVKPASVFADEEEVDGFGDLNLMLDEEGDREERFQSIMNLANGEVFGPPVEWYDDEIFKERFKYGVPNNRNLLCSEMGLRIGFLNENIDVSLYEPIYEAVDNMVRLEYKLIDANTFTATLPKMSEVSNPVLVDGDIETYSLRFDDSSDTQRAYSVFWKDFVNKINDLPSVDCSLVISYEDLSVLDFKRRYDFGLGDCVLVSINGFDFTLDESKVSAKFLIY